MTSQGVFLNQGSLQGFVKHVLDEEYTEIRTVTSKTIQKQIKTASKPFPQPCYIYTTRTIVCMHTHTHTHMHTHAHQSREVGSIM